MLTDSLVEIGRRSFEIWMFEFLSMIGFRWDIVHLE